MKHPFRSEAASETRRRLYGLFEEALQAGDVPNAVVFLRELERFGVRVSTLSHEQQRLLEADNNQRDELVAPVHGRQARRDRGQ